MKMNYNIGMIKIKMIKYYQCSNFLKMKNFNF